MFTLETLTSLIFDIGLTLGVGSSTFALTFFISAIMDGTIDPSERRFMHIVYRVLRIGMFLIVAGLVGSVLIDAVGFNTQYVMQWILMAVIVVNAILMTLHLMPMKIGPVLAGGSWYSLFFVSSLPVAMYPLTTLLIAYAVFLVVFYVVFSAIRSFFVPAKPSGA